jgi:serine/threonine-protein kinase
MVLDEGTRVTDSVRLVRPLGKGGMGSVWVARHETLDAEVAIKFVSPELAEKDPSILSRFQREAALSAKLKSPYAVKTFDFGIMDDGRPYIVMELLEGETLGRRLERERRLSRSDAAQVVGQIAQVLDEAHRLGVVHRDIKPDNVFLLAASHNLFVKVLDFGIAKQTTAGVSQVTDTGIIVGTPEYMSPEQLLSAKDVDERADIWALAVLAYHLITGELPFRGETLPSLSIEICGGRFQLPSVIYQDGSTIFDAFFERAFDPDSKQRYPTVIELADSFRSIALDGMAAALAPTERQPSSNPSESTAGTTLASAEPAPGSLRASVAPTVAVESARSSDSGVHEAVKDASADESGRRPVAASATLATGHTPTFSGAASTLEPESVQARRRSRLKLALVLAAGVVAAVVVDRSLRSEPAVSETKAARSTEEGAAEPTSAPKADPSEPDEPEESEPARSATRPAASGDEPPVANATSSAAAASSASLTSPRPAPRRPPQPKTRASATKGDCENPYVVLSDGTLGVKPGCL